jgi:hypothetical protein
MLFTDLEFKVMPEIPRQQVKIKSYSTGMEIQLQVTDLCVLPLSAFRNIRSFVSEGCRKKHQIPYRDSSRSCENKNANEYRVKVGARKSHCLEVKLKYLHTFDKGKHSIDVQKGMGLSDSAERTICDKISVSGNLKKRRKFWPQNTNKICLCLELSFKRR